MFIMATCNERKEKKKGEVEMGWLYYTISEKDVFVLNVTSFRSCGVITHRALWYDEAMQEWVESNLAYFRPPKEKH